MRDHVFEVYQGGMMVAKAISTKRNAAYAEAMHYAMVYRQDGPVKIKEINPRGASGVEIDFSHAPK
jgi:hypothetical protein